MEDKTLAGIYKQLGAINAKLDAKPCSVHREDIKEAIDLGHKAKDAVGALKVWLLTLLLLAVANAAASGIMWLVSRVKT